MKGCYRPEAVIGFAASIPVTLVVLPLRSCYKFSFIYETILLEYNLGTLLTDTGRSSRGIIVFRRFIHD